MKKLVILAILALSVMASARTSNIIVPLPSCRPCPYVR